MRILVTGGTGKVGQALLPALLADARYEGADVVALCHNRSVGPADGLTVLRGSINDATSVAAAMEGVTHVLHLAAVKESPDMAIDVSVKGMFSWGHSTEQMPFCPCRLANLSPMIGSRRIR